MLDRLSFCPPERVVMEQTHGVEVFDTAKDAYFAGIIDGEGSVTISIYRFKRKNGAINTNCTIKIYVTSTDKNLIDWILENYGGRVYDKLNDIGHLGTKICYRWQAFSRKSILRIISHIEPYLIIKKPHVKLIKEFYRGLICLNGKEINYRNKEWKRRLKLRNKINKLNSGKLKYDEWIEEVLSGTYN